MQEAKNTKEKRSGSNWFELFSAPPQNGTCEPVWALLGALYNLSQAQTQHNGGH